MHTAVTSICQIVGGLALFMYGIDLAAQGLRTAAAARLTVAIRLLARNRVLAVLAGVFVTLCMQSSGATMALLVSLVDAGMVSLVEAVSLIIGAAIGTTLTVQIIAFDISRYAVLLFGVGFLVESVSRYRRRKAAGELLMGFGALFLGMQLLSDGMGPLRALPQITAAVKMCADHPLIGVAVSSVVTAFLLSSHATLAIAIALASQNVGSADAFQPLLPLNAALPIVLGANIGTCVVAFIASLKCGRSGKQVALATLLYKVAGALIFLPFLVWFADFIEWATRLMAGSGLDAGVARRQIANAHMFFNIGCAILFTPFVGYLVKAVEFLLPVARENVFDRTTFLSDEKTLLANPDLAVAATWREISAMSQTVFRMFGAVIRAFNRKDDMLLDEIERTDDELDLRNDAIMRLLTQLSEERKEMRTCKATLFAASAQMESIGDVISKTLVGLGRKLVAANVSYSAQTSAYLRRVETRMLEALNSLRRIFAEPKELKALTPGLEEAARALLRECGNPLAIYAAERKASGELSSEAGAILLDLMEAFQHMAERLQAIASRLEAASEDRCCEEIAAMASRMNREETG